VKRVILSLLLVTAACSDAPRFSAGVGDQAPAYGASLLGGDSVSLAQLKGNVVLLNVWATWCIPCRKELPELQALHKQYEPRGLRVVGVSVDETGTDSSVREYAQELGITYSILRDPDQRVYSAFSIVGVPASFLIDREGRIAWMLYGPFTSTNPELQRALQKTL
jgi:cytochrome c biogenesis protein CcmG, thiol:disulfide interchange protein DsbE